jgi:hypothetical protein
VAICGFVAICSFPESVCAREAYSQEATAMIYLLLAICSFVIACMHLQAGGLGVDRELQSLSLRLCALRSACPLASPRAPRRNFNGSLEAQRTCGADGWWAICPWWCWWRCTIVLEKLRCFTARLLLATQLQGQAYCAVGQGKLRVWQFTNRICNGTLVHRLASEFEGTASE